MENEAFTFWALFGRATITVKIVMIMLIGSSFWSWSIIFKKLISFRTARTEASNFDQSFWSGEPLDELFEKLGPDPTGHTERVFAAGMVEWERSHRSDGVMIAGAQARIDRSMDVAVVREAEDLQSGLTILATIGSTAPFIGLFGTVWGIMNAFIEIAEQQNTNLAVVAPGIAEALLATGLGLLAAIPAVIAFNRFTSKADSYLQTTTIFAEELASIFYRESVKQKDDL